MTTPHRTRILGDLDENAPERVGVGRPGRPADRLALLLLYARDGAGLATLEAEQTRPARGEAGSRVRAPARDVGPRRLRAVRLPRRDLAAVRRGPLEAGPARDDRPRRRVPARLPERVRPLHRPPAARRVGRPGSTLPRDPEGSGRADLGRNGTYLVFRQLRQDVAGFWRYVDGATRRPDGSSDPEARLRLAAKMVGRWPSGAPLTLAPDADDPSLAERERLRLPRARPARRPLPGRLAHPPLESARLARPETGQRAARWEINRRHRILRRGREYGPSLPIEQALAGGRREPSAASTSSA